MGKKTPKAPAAPDPVATAAAQTASNKDTAYWNAVLNNVNQVTPYGNLTYTQTGGGKKYNMDAYNAAMNAFNTAAGAAPVNQYAGFIAGDPDRAGNVKTYYNPQTGQNITADQYRAGGGGVGSSNMPMPKLEDFYISEAPPSFTSTVNLSPESQRLLDTQMRSENALATMGEQQLGRINQAVSTPYSYAGLGDAPTAESIAEASRRAEEAILSRLNPQFSSDEEALRTRLINQGIGQGSRAFESEFNSLNRARNDARMQAILQGANYGGTLQQQALQRRNQGIQEYDTQRNAPLNEYNALTSGVQIQNPQFSSQSYQGANPVDYASLVNNQYQGQLGQYNARVAGNNATTSALFGLGGQLGGSFLGSQAGSAAMTSLFSDIRLKQDIKEIGEENGHKMYEFAYHWEPEKRYIGVMAQDVLQTHPEAVAVCDGFLCVNYDAIGVKMREI